MKLLPTKSFVVFIFAFLFCIPLYSQKYWTKVILKFPSEDLVSSVETSNGDFISVGHTYGSTVNIFLMKTSNTGDTLWFKKNQSPNYTISNNIISTKDSNYLISSTIVSDTSSKIQLIKINEDGDTLWTKNFDWATYLASGGVVEDTIGNIFILCGQSSYCGLIKTNAIGDTIWTRSFTEDPKLFINSIKKISDGVIISGYCIDSTSPPNKPFLKKVNDEGLVQWTKKYSLPGLHLTYINDVTETFDGNYIVACSTYFQQEQLLKLGIVKVNSMGDTLWTKYISNTNHQYIAQSITTTSDGNFVLTGSTFDPNPPISTVQSMFWMKINQDADTLWCKLFGAPEYGFGKEIKEISNHDLLITGSFGSHLFLAKIDSNGTIHFSDPDSPYLNFKNLSLYPLPASDIMNIKLSDPTPESYYFIMKNQSEQMVICQLIPASTSDFQINLNGLLNGMYLFTISDTDNKIYYSGKLLVDH